MRRVVARLLVALVTFGAASVGIASLAEPAGADISWGTPSEVAGPLNADGDAVVNSVSCSSGGNCTAGGYYEDGFGKTQAFVVDEGAGTWGTPYEVAASLNAGGGAWVNSISCPSAGNCAAGGRYRDSSGNYQNFVVDDVAGTWGPAMEIGASLNVDGHAWINAVSCSSDGNCAAGGRYEDGSGRYQVFVVDEVDGTWGSATEVAGSLNAGGDADLNSVSCTSDGNCAAGGRYSSSTGDYQAFVVDEVDGTWGTASEVAGSLNTGNDAQVFSVSCTSVGNCAAGGRYVSSGTYQAFLVDEVDGTWGTASAVADSLNTGGLARVWSAACTADGNCAAGGRYKVSSGNSQAFVVDEVAGVWGAASEVAGSLNIDGDAWINSVSCISDGNCTAGGYYKDGSGDYQAFVVDEVDGVWNTAGELAGSLNAGGDGETNSVSCTADGGCASGGFYKDGSGKTQAFVVSEISTVTFDANGGSGTMSPQSSTSGVAEALAPNAFTLSGYSFSGWNTTANGSGTAYTGGATYAFGDNITLYAQWGANSEDVSFNANGGSGTMPAESYTTGSAQSLLPNTFTYTGHDFTGWNTAANGSGAEYSNRQFITINGAISLYAQWIAKPLPKENLEAHPSDAVLGKYIRLRVHLVGKMGKVSGRVDVSFAGRTLCSAAVITGVAACSVNSSQLGLGAHRLLAKYGGFGAYRSCSKSIVVRVR